MTVTTIHPSISSGVRAGAWHVSRSTRSVSCWRCCFCFPSSGRLDVGKAAPEASAVPPTYLPSTITFENYAKLNKYGAGVFQYVFNSASMALITVFGTIILSTLAGFGFSRFQFPGKNVFFILVLQP